MSNKITSKLQARLIGVSAAAILAASVGGTAHGQIIIGIDGGAADDGTASCTAVFGEICIGDGATAGSVASTAVGANTLANGVGGGSTAVGVNAIASGTQATALGGAFFGSSTTAAGAGSIAIGGGDGGGARKRINRNWSRLCCQPE